MIKMSELLKSKRRIVFVIGLLSIVFLSSLLLTSGKIGEEVLTSKDKNPTVISREFNEDVENLNSSKDSMEKLTLKVLVFPGRYIPTMSIAP